MKYTLHCHGHGKKQRFFVYKVGQNLFLNSDNSWDVSSEVKFFKTRREAIQSLKKITSNVKKTYVGKNHTAFEDME